MIPRILVPREVKPASGEARNGARRSTYLDERRVVPADLPDITLDGRTQIPAHLPLEVLGERLLVPRDLPAGTLQVTRAGTPEPPIQMRGVRLVVPGDPGTLQPAQPAAGRRLPEVVDPDIFNTGEAQLLAHPVERGVHIWRGEAGASTVLFHLMVIGLALLQPKLFPYQPPTAEQIELARRSLGLVYLPPEAENVPRRDEPRAESSPKITIDPRILRQLAQPSEVALSGPKPEEPRVVQPNLPVAPTAQTPSSPSPESASRFENPREIPRSEPQRPANAAPQLGLPRSSPGRMLEDSLRGAARGGRRGDSGLGDLSPGAGGGGGQGYLGGNLEMLTPDQGVDFSNYFARVLASVKRNWYAVIPESARLGERGRVVLQFRIQKDGSVNAAEPYLVGTSGREPLDRAAISAIRQSNPFEPLPGAFSGPFIELRFTFLYNIPLNER